MITRVASLLQNFGIVNNSLLLFLKYCTNLDDVMVDSTDLTEESSPQNTALKVKQFSQHLEIIDYMDVYISWSNIKASSLPQIRTPWLWERTENVQNISCARQAADNFQRITVRMILSISLSHEVMILKFYSIHSKGFAIALSFLWCWKCENLVPCFSC